MVMKPSQWLAIREQELSQALATLRSLSSSLMLRQSKPETNWLTGSKQQNRTSKASLWMCPANGGPYWYRLQRQVRWSQRMAIDARWCTAL